MSDELPILDGEVLDDVVQETLFDLEPEDDFDSIDLAQARPEPASAPQELPNRVNLRRHPHWVSQATTNRRADLVYDAYMDGLRIREIAAQSESILGVALGKTRIGQLKELGEQRYDAQTKARRERGIDASEAKLDWAQRKATRALTQMAELFSETGTVEMVAKAIAANPEMASEILMNVMNSGKSVIEGAKHFVDSEHKRTEWLGTRAPRRTENKNLNMNLNAELTEAAKEQVASNPLLEGMRQRALTATRQEEPMPDLTGALREGSATRHG